MVGRVKRALRRGMLAGSLVLAIMGAVGLVGATTALADTGYTISRYAGQANSAGGATPGPALSSQLSFVVGAGLDPAGNLYIVDPNNVEVEKVTPGGTLSIFAGAGQSGPPVPGPASNSTLNNPAGVASDSAGNVYIADQNNHVVEKVAHGRHAVRLRRHSWGHRAAHGRTGNELASGQPLGHRHRCRRQRLHRRLRQQGHREGHAEPASSPSSPVLQARRAPRRRDPPPARTSPRRLVSPSTRSATSTSPTQAPT